MTGHALDVLFGFLGGAIPGSIHLAWKVTRNDTTRSGVIDLTYRGPRKKKP